MAGYGRVDSLCLLFCPPFAIVIWYPEPINQKLHYRKLYVTYSVFLKDSGLLGLAYQIITPDCRSVPPIPGKAV